MMVGAIGSSSEPRLGVGLTLYDPSHQAITLCYSQISTWGTRMGGLMKNKCWGWGVRGNTISPIKDFVSEGAPLR